MPTRRTPKAFEIVDTGPTLAQPAENPGEIEAPLRAELEVLVAHWRSELATYARVTLRLEQQRDTFRGPHVNSEQVITFNGGYISALRACIEQLDARLHPTPDTLDDLPF